MPHTDDHYGGDLVRCDGCDQPFDAGELGYCTECSYDLCEDCLVSGHSLDGRHTEDCLNLDEDEDSSPASIDKELII